MRNAIADMGRQEEGQNMALPSVHASQSVRGYLVVSRYREAAAEGSVSLARGYHQEGTGKARAPGTVGFKRCPRQSKWAGPVGVSARMG